MAISPAIAATNEVIKITAFPIFTICISENARLSIKIDIVKPIPAIIPADRICVQLISPGKSAILSFTDIQLARKIPIGFPVSRPRNIPGTIGSRGGVNRAKSIFTPALASAKMGIIKKVTQG